METTVITSREQLREQIAEAFAERNVRFGKEFRQAEEGSEMYQLYELLNTVAINLLADKLSSTD